MIRKLLAAALAFVAIGAYAAVDVNKASRADLESVKGIGPALSAKIVKAREAGTFKGWGDLVERVGGIGPGNAARLSQAGLTVTGSAFDAKAAGLAEPRAAKAKASTEPAAPPAKAAPPSAKPRALNARPAPV